MGKIGKAQSGGTGAVRGLAVLALVVWLGAVGPSGAQQPPSTPAGPPTPQEWADALDLTRQIALDTNRPPEQRANAVMAHARMQLARGAAAEALKTCWEVFDNPKEQAVAEAALRAACLVSRSAQGHLGGPQQLLAEWAKKAKGPASTQALRTLTNDYARMAGYLMSLAAQRPTPPPVRPELPQWGRPAGPAGPGVLRFASPNVVAPNWLAPQPGEGLRVFQVPVPAVKPEPGMALDKLGVPKALQLSLPEYVPPELMARDQTGCPRALLLKLPEYVAADWYRRLQLPTLKEAPKP